MPIINVKVIEGVFSDAQKQLLIGRLTDALVDIGGEGLRDVTVVVVEDVKSGELGISGKPVTVENVKALIAGQKKAA